MLTGPVGVGKSTLFELLKFAIGGNARIAPVARDHVQAVRVELEIGHQLLRLTRSLAQSNYVTVYDVREGHALGRFNVTASRAGDADETVSSVLMTSMGLPTDMFATTRARSYRITFNNVWSFVYAEQREIDRSIARNNDNYSEPARKTTFELLFGLTDYHVLELRKRQREIEEDRQRAVFEERTVVDFLAQSKTKTRSDAEAIVDENRRLKRDAEVRIDSLQRESNVVRGEVAVVRDLVLQARDDLSKLQHEQKILEAEQADRRKILARLRVREFEIERSREAVNLLGPIRFVVCPRCAQSLENRPHDEGTCELCLQPDPEPDALLLRRAENESSRIPAQIEELETLIATSETEAGVFEERIRLAQMNLGELERVLDERTSYFIAPRLEQFTDSSSEIARADAIISAMEDVLRQWDRAQDLQIARLSADQALETISKELAGAVDSLEGIRDHLLNALSEDYEQMVLRLQVPTVKNAYIDRSNYLPFANGDRFDRISTGGITTGLITAYWVTVLATALRERQTQYPTLLIIDTPRKSIGQQNAHMADELYRQLDTLAEINGDRMQVIVADNDIPSDISARWQDIRFDYENPTVATVTHPGPTNVTTIDAD